jgi:hypothetical protein
MTSTKNITGILLFFLLASCLPSKNIIVTKNSGSQGVSEKSIIYALPQTGISVTLEVTKTVIKKGPFAAYAQKYLHISNVPMEDSASWKITDVKIGSQIEADPSQYYAITYKTYPENLSNLLSISNKGIILDFANAWAKNLYVSKTITRDSEFLFDPKIIDETVKDRVDTFYKTVMNDTSFIRIPVFKKQTEAKTIEDVAKETAHQLIKTRKRKLKMLRGEYEFHPDGKAIELSVNELEKEEAELLTMFYGIKVTKSQYIRFVEIPQTEPYSKELCYFSGSHGVMDTKTEGSFAILLQVAKEQVSQSPPTSPSSIKAQNILYMRVPLMSSIKLLQNQEELANARIPVYQFGTVQAIPLK